MTKTESRCDETELSDFVESPPYETQTGGVASNLIILAGAASSQFWPHKQPDDTDIYLVDPNNSHFKSNPCDIIENLESLNNNNRFFEISFEDFLNDYGCKINLTYRKVLIISYTVEIDYYLLKPNIMYFNLGHFGEGIDIEKAAKIFELDWKTLRVTAHNSNKLKFEIDLTRDKNIYDINSFNSLANYLLELKELRIKDYVLNEQLNYMTDNLEYISNRIKYALGFFIKHKINFYQTNNSIYVIPRNLQEPKLNELLNTISEDDNFKTHFSNYYDIYNTLDASIPIEKYKDNLLNILHKLKCY